MTQGSTTPRVGVQEGGRKATDTSWLTHPPKAVPGKISTGSLNCSTLDIVNI
jgi:hypothetical protein